MLHAWDGRALARLEEAGRRAELRACLAPSHPAAVTAALRALEKPPGGGALAIIGPAPFERTGVGRFCDRFAREAEVPVDYFAPAHDIARFLAWGERLARAAPDARLLALEAAGLAALRHDYRAIVVMVGNSEHMARPWRAAGVLSELGARARVFHYLHDVSLMSLLWRDVEGDPALLQRRLRAAYPRLSAVEATSPEAFAGLIAAGALGARALLAAAAPDRVLVNSEAAAALARAELDGTPLADRVSTVFHPVFKPLASHSGSPDGALRVASFGLPGGAKNTELVIAACARLAARGVDARLTLAGFGVDDYVAERGAPPPDFVDVRDGPDDAALEALMAASDVAVQLRRDWHGESSGVLAQLIGVGTPVIASNVGGFAELGGAVALADADIDADGLADMIVRRAAAPQSAAPARAGPARTASDLADAIARLAD